MTSKKFAWFPFNGNANPVPEGRADLNDIDWFDERSRCWGSRTAAPFTRTLNSMQGDA